MQTPLEEAATTLRLALEHQSLFTTSELLAKGQDFVRAAKRAVANENRYFRNRARVQPNPDREV